MVISSIEPERFVFVDECSTNTSLAPLYGWATKGERAHQKAPRNWGKNITLISSIGKESGMGVSLVVEGSTRVQPTRRFSKPICRRFCCPR
jgi:hypothetical protein